MRTGGKKKGINLYLNKSGKTVDFSAAATRFLDGYTDIEIYEKESVIAIQMVAHGRYYLSGEAGRARKRLSNTQFVSYLCEKFHITLRRCVPGWTGVRDDVLFFGMIQPEEQPLYQLDDSYRPLELEYNRRVGDWAYVHDNWIEFTQDIRKLLPERMSAFKRGRKVLLLGDVNGPLTMTCRREKQIPMLVSSTLADYLRALYSGEKRGMRLYAKAVPGGVMLVDSTEELSARMAGRLKRLSLTESRCYFISMGNSKGTFYLSAAAGKKLQSVGRVALYGCGDYLALKAQRNGPFRVTANGYTHYLYGTALTRAIKERWPGVRKLYLLPYGDLWLLRPELELPAWIPHTAAFQCLSDVTPSKAREKAPIEDKKDVSPAKRWRGAVESTEETVERR